MTIVQHARADAPPGADGRRRAPRRGGDLDPGRPRRAVRHGGVARAVRLAAHAAAAGRVEAAPLALRPVYRRAPDPRDDRRRHPGHGGAVRRGGRLGPGGRLRRAPARVSNAKLLDQFLSRSGTGATTSSAGRCATGRGCSSSSAAHIAERAGADFTVTVKVPVGEKAPPFTRHTTWDEGIELCRIVEEWGYDSVTPVEVSVFPDTTLSRGGIPTSIWKNKAMQNRFRAAAPHRSERRSGTSRRRTRSRRASPFGVVTVDGTTSTTTTVMLSRPPDASAIGSAPAATSIGRGRGRVGVDDGAHAACRGGAVRQAVRAQDEPSRPTAALKVVTRGAPPVSPHPTTA